MTKWRLGLNESRKLPKVERNARYSSSNFLLPLLLLCNKFDFQVAKLLLATAKQNRVGVNFQDGLQHNPSKKSFRKCCYTAGSQLYPVGRVQISPFSDK